MGKGRGLERGWQLGERVSCVVDAIFPSKSENRETSGWLFVLQRQSSSIEYERPAPRRGGVGMRRKTFSGRKINVKESFLENLGQGKEKTR